MNELVEPHRERIYPPLYTLRLFVGQVLSADRACQDVVGRRLSERVAQGQSLSALNTSAYCEARQRLPTTLPVALGTMIGERLEVMTPAAWRWQGRCVKLFDGTTVTMPDTPSNQETYPQSRDLAFPSPALARSSAYPAVQCWPIKWPPAKARGRVSKVCWQTCWII